MQRLENPTADLVTGARLRASINLGNAVLARQDAPGALPYGVSVDIARAMAEKLGVAIEFVVCNSAGQSVDAVSRGVADVGFFAIDPHRGESVLFSDAYLEIEGWYAVSRDSPIRSVEEVDSVGVSVAVSRASAYDLYLSRELKNAEIIRAPNPQAVAPQFITQNIDVMAGVRQQLEADMRHYPGLRLLPERFMVIRQAMGLARSRSGAAHAYLAAFVEELKAGNFIAQALARHGIEGASLVSASGSAPR